MRGEEVSRAPGLAGAEKTMTRPGGHLQRGESQESYRPGQRPVRKWQVQGRKEETTMMAEVSGPGQEGFRVPCVLEGRGPLLRARHDFLREHRKMGERVTGRCEPASQAPGPG